MELQMLWLKCWEHRSQMMVAAVVGLLTQNQRKVLWMLLFQAETLPAVVLEPELPSQRKMKE